MNSIFAVAVGGAIGSTARYLFGMQMLRLMGPNFPWGTFGVNLIGSLIMGLLAGAFALKFNVSHEMRSFLMTGILGGFTTFSAFSLDAAVMMERHDYAMAGLYMFGSVAGALLCLFIGLWVARLALA
ncbi:MAG: fluoride efflux transporter CrcB [Parvibaculum sp.]